MQIIGYIASFLFIACAIPQSYQSWQQGHSRGVNPLFIGAWLLGEVLMMLYVYLDQGWDGPLMLNYIGNLVFASPILYYMVFPRRNYEIN